MLSCLQLFPCLITFFTIKFEQENPIIKVTEAKLFRYSTDHPLPDTGALIQHGPTYQYHRAFVKKNNLYPTFNYFHLGLSWAKTDIWLICTRSSTPLEICRWFPQIVFIIFNRVRPINVGFSNRFFCLSDKRFLNIIIKKN